MLNEKRVIHMTKMEIRRRKDYADFAPFINVDKKDYLSFKRVEGFVIGTLFYGVVLCVAILALFSTVITNLKRPILIFLIIVAVVGYIVFIFFYQSWYHAHNVVRFRQAKRGIIRLRNDLGTLEDMYIQEEEDMRPTIDMNLLFPEGSLGENE